MKELCNSVTPPIIANVYTESNCYEEELHNSADEATNHWINETCYEWRYNPDYINSCHSINGFDYVQYNE